MVCAGNLARSPSAELLLRSQVSAGEVLVGSAGVIAPVGQPAHPWTAAALAELGVDASAHRARRLLPEHLESSDLVLTATRGLRADAVRLHPSMVSRVWTLREFVRHAEAAQLADHRQPSTGAARLWELQERTRTLRGTLPRLAPEEDDVFDPIEGPEEAHRRMVALVAEATSRLARLFGATDGRPVSA
jgi:protein-tyrosine phosphatase